jgi:peptidyl-prolyl cis-trans isomerase C
MAAERGIWIVSCVAVLAACTAPGPDEGPGTVVATAGPVRLVEEEVELAVDAQRMFGTDKTRKELRRQAAEDVLSRKLLAQEAQRRGLDRAPEVVRDLQRLDEGIAMDLYSFGLAGSETMPAEQLDAALAPLRGKVDPDQIEFRRRQFLEQWRLDLGTGRRVRELDAAEKTLDVWIDEAFLASIGEAAPEQVVARSGPVELTAADVALIFPPGAPTERVPLERRRLLLRQAVAFRVLARRKIAEGILELPAFRKRREASVEERLAEAVQQDELARSLQRELLDPQGYWRAHPGEFALPEEVHARHILLTYRGVPGGRQDRGRDEAEALARRVVERLRAGERFEALAAEASDLPDRAGDLGFFQKEGVMESALAEAAFQAQPGQAVGPVETRHGFHVLEVLERRVPGVRPFEAVADELAARLRLERKKSVGAELLRRLRGSDDLVLDPGYFGR